VTAGSPIRVPARVDMPAHDCGSVMIAAVPGSCVSFSACLRDIAA
jgi:hypothetical protein